MIGNEDGVKERRVFPRKIYYFVIGGLVLYLVLDILAQLLPPYYNPISQAESDLAVGKYGYIMTLNFVNRGILSLLFVFAFLRTLDWMRIPRSKFRGGSYMLEVWAAGALILSIFPTDVPAAPISWHGAIHLVVAVIAFIGGAFGTFLISRNLGRFRVMSGLKRISLPLSLLTLLFWVVEFSLPFVAPSLNARIGGLTERIFLGSVLLWIGLTSGYIASHGRTLIKKDTTIENAPQNKE